MELENAVHRGDGPDHARERQKDLDRRGMARPGHQRAPVASVLIGDQFSTCVLTARRVPSAAAGDSHLAGSELASVHTVCRRSAWREAAAPRRAVRSWSAGQALAACAVWPVPIPDFLSANSSGWFRPLRSNNEPPRWGRRTGRLGIGRLDPSEGTLPRRAPVTSHLPGNHCQIDSGTRTARSSPPRHLLATSAQIASTSL